MVSHQNGNHVASHHHEILHYWYFKVSILFSNFSVLLYFLVAKHCHYAYFGAS